MMRSAAVALQLPEGSLIAATAVAIAAGAMYTASPSSVWCAAAAAGLVVYAVRELQGRERVWVIGTLLLAVGVRAALIAGLPLANDYSQGTFRVLFPDAEYMIRRSLWLRHFVVGEPIAARDLFEAFNAQYASTAYYYVLAYLQVLLGPAPYGLHLFSALLYLASAVVLYRVVRASFGAVAAYVGLVAVLFMPTLLFWSVSPLKEPAFLLLLAGAIVAAVKITRTRAWTVRVVAMLTIAAGALFVDELRGGGAVVLLGGVACGLAALAVRRLAPGKGALLAATGLAIVALGVLLSSEAILTRAVDAAQLAAGRHLGHVYTFGRAYTLLDPEYYWRGAAALAEFDAGEAVRFLSWSVIRFFTVPEPWNIGSPLEAALLPQQLAWYALVVMMGVGSIVGAGRDALVTGLLVGTAAVGVAVIAPNSGNIGTLIRHRDTVSPFLLWMSGVGVAWTLARLASRRGRLMRLNSVDAAVLLFLLVLVPAGYGFYWFLRTPPMEIARVEPDSWVAGEPRRVTLHGRHLEPFLRAFYARSGQSLELLDRHQWPDSAPMLLRDPNTAELELPAMAAGTYDLGFYRFSELIARKNAAFTVVPAESTADASEQMLLLGSFILNTEHAARLEAGLVLDLGSASGDIVVAEVGEARPDFVEVSAGTSVQRVPVSSRVRRPATLRVTCDLNGAQCVVGGVNVLASGTLQLRAGDRTYEFRTRSARAAGEAAESQVNVRVRFAAPREVLALVAPNDRAEPAAPDASRAAGAVVRTVTREGGSAMAVLRVPVTRGPDGFYYRGVNLRPGAPFSLETADYVVSGWVVAVDVQEHER